MENKSDKMAKAWNALFRRQNTTPEVSGIYQQFLEMGLQPEQVSALLANAVAKKKRGPVVAAGAFGGEPVENHYKFFLNRFEPDLLNEMQQEMVSNPYYGGVRNK